MNDDDDAFKDDRTAIARFASAFGLAQFPHHLQFFILLTISIFCCPRNKHIENANEAQNLILGLSSIYSIGRANSE